MISLRRVCLLLVVSFGTFATSCSTIPNPPLGDCGRFGFTPSTDTNSTGQAALFNLIYTHVPKNCPINCGNYWFVQALRPLDIDTGEYIQPHDAQQDRMVKGRATSISTAGRSIEKRVGGSDGTASPTSSNSNHRLAFQERHLLSWARDPRPR